MKKSNVFLCTPKLNSVYNWTQLSPWTLCSSGCAVLWLFPSQKHWTRIPPEWFQNAPSRSIFSPRNSSGDSEAQGVTTPSICIPYGISITNKPNLNKNAPLCTQTLPSSVSQRINILAMHSVQWSSPAQNQEQLALMADGFLPGSACSHAHMEQTQLSLSSCLLSPTTKVLSWAPAWGWGGGFGIVLCSATGNETAASQRAMLSTALRLKQFNFPRPQLEERQAYLHWISFLEMNFVGRGFLLDFSDKGHRLLNKYKLSNLKHCLPT